MVTQATEHLRITPTAKHTLAQYKLDTQSKTFSQAVLRAIQHAKEHTKGGNDGSAP